LFSFHVVPVYFKTIFIFFCNWDCRPYSLYCLGGDVKPCSINFLTEILDSRPC